MDDLSYMIILLTVGLVMIGLVTAFRNSISGEITLVGLICGSLFTVLGIMGLVVIVIG